jgi:hypothetical protein
MCVCVWGSLQWLQRVYVPPIINILLHGTQFRGASLLKPRLLLLLLVQRKCYREMCKSVEAPECTYSTLLSVPCLLISFLTYLPCHKVVVEVVASVSSRCRSM